MSVATSVPYLLDRVDAYLNTDEWQPYPWQIPPAEIAVQGTWLIVGGRGIGKTDGCAHYVDQHVNGPPCDPRVPGGHRVAIIAPTLGDAVESCVNGPSGIRQYNPDVRLREGGVGGSLIRWPSGAEGRLFGAFTPQDVERLRAGGNRCLVWLEEAAAMRYLGDAVKQARYGLRLGRSAHFVGSSTPKPTKDFRELLAAKDTVVFRGLPTPRRTRPVSHRTSPPRYSPSVALAMMFRWISFEPA